MLVYQRVRFSNKGWPDKSSRSRRFAEFPGIGNPSRFQRPKTPRFVLVRSRVFAMGSAGFFPLLSWLWSLRLSVPSSFWTWDREQGRSPCTMRELVHHLCRNRAPDPGWLEPFGADMLVCWLRKHCSAMQSWGKKTSCKGLVPIQKIKTFACKTTLW